MVRRLTQIPVSDLISIVYVGGVKSLNEEDALKDVGRAFLWLDDGLAHTQAEVCLAEVLDGDFSPWSKSIALYCLTHKEARLLTPLAKEILEGFAKPNP